MKTTEQLQEAYEAHKEVIAVPVSESTGLKKPKIALCISGQTRDINENHGIQHLLEVISIFEDEYDVDLYGHTWTDQEDPYPILLNRFCEYQKEEQSVIWDTITSPDNIVQDWSRQGWDYWFQTKKSWWNDPDYMAILNGTSETSYIDFAKERIYGTVGQVWSAQRSFNLVSDNIEKQGYKAIVRLRWDMCINWSQGRPRTEERIETFKQQLYDWIYSKNDFAENQPSHSLYSNCMAADHTIIHDFNAPFFNDFCFVFKGNDSNVIKDIVLTDVMHVFKKIFSDLSETGHSHLPSSHTLWAQYLIAQRLKIIPKLPDIFNAYGALQKSNKRWGT